MIAISTTTSPGRMPRARHALRSATASPLGRLALFGIIGLTGFAPNLATLFVVSGLLGMHYVPATVIATQVATLWNFVLLEQVVYRRHPRRQWYGRAATFAAINNMDLLLRIPLLAALVEEAHINYLLATVITLVAIFVMRFLVTDRLIYRLGRREPVVATLATDTGPLVASRRPLALEEI
jgi:dolichol-phosphate mannosyltransferase